MKLNTQEIVEGNFPLLVLVPENQNPSLSESTKRKLSNSSMERRSRARISKVVGRCSRCLRNGKVLSAEHFTDDIGDIDLVWGDSEAGLEHIIQRRMDKGQNLKRVLMNLSTAIQNGRLERAGERNGSVAIRYGKQRVCLSTRKKGRDISFVITAYELDAK